MATWANSEHEGRIRAADCRTSRGEIDARYGQLTCLDCRGPVGPVFDNKGRCIDYFRHEVGSTCPLANTPHNSESAKHYDAKWTLADALERCAGRGGCINLREQCVGEQCGRMTSLGSYPLSGFGVIVEKQRDVSGKTFRGDVVATHERFTSDDGETRRVELWFEVVHKHPVPREKRELLGGDRDVILVELSVDQACSLARDLASQPVSAATVSFRKCDACLASARVEEDRLNRLVNSSVTSSRQPHSAPVHTKKDVDGDPRIGTGTPGIRCPALRWTAAEQAHYEAEMGEMGEDATPNTQCSLNANHDGGCCFETVINMEGILPLCRLCGQKAARCPCPKFDADGRSTVLPVPDPPVTDALRAVYETNAKMTAGRPWRPSDAKPAKRFSYEWVPPPPEKRKELDSPPDKPWAPCHGSEHPDPTCWMCQQAAKEYEARGRAEHDGQ